MNFKIFKKEENDFKIFKKEENDLEKCKMYCNQDE